VVYVNREEDVNNLGLREAKLQLHPVEILDKCFFEVLSPIDLVKTLPELKGERVVLAPLKKEEEEGYAQLNRDVELNRYWGYDYRYDLPEGVSADAAYFARDLAQDFANKTEVSFIIHDLEGHFLGQVVLENFTTDRGLGIGIRLKKEAQKHGYAFEAVSLALAYAKDVLGFAYARYECFLPNEASIALAKRLGFSETSQDRLKIHYEKRF
jgi:RimJ/RimL family protein N-acetyltransferase